jgi:glycosyltransferase involved in cell wall biosynthesis
MKRLSVDLRSLNYPIRTGINIYFLNILKVLSEIKQENSNLEITGFGLDNKIYQNLGKEYAWFDTLFVKNYSLPEYYNINWVSKIWFLPKIYLDKIINICVWIANIIGINFTTNTHSFTHLYQPQIKAILAPSNTNWLVATHDFFHFQMPRWNNALKRPNESFLLARSILSKTNLIFSNSISTANQIKYLFPKTIEKVKLVYLALPQNLNSKQTNQPEIDDAIIQNILNSGQKYFIALAGIESRKNWINLIHAWKELEVKGFEYKLVLAGRIVTKDYYKDLLKLIRRLELQNIIWVLNPNDSQKIALLSNSVALLYPSLFEGFGFPILEAFSAGVPAIVGNTGSSLEVGGTGVICLNPLDIADIASAIELISIDNSFRMELIKNGQDRLKIFSWEEYRNNLENWIINS